MTRTLSERGQAILDTIPFYYAEDPAALSVIGACANEIDRIQAMLDALQDGAFPQVADDTYGLLSLWEFLVSLPIAPPASLAARQGRVRASRRLKVATGTDWAAALTTAIGTASWSHLETPGIRVTITIPLEAGSYEGATVVQIARKLTPAHLEVAFTYSQGFLLGISKLGDAL
jgi:uncharacterized protein YmfQ (DUF2313 family)